MLCTSKCVTSNPVDSVVLLFLKVFQFLWPLTSLYMQAWKADSSSVCKRRPVWSACLCSTPCVSDTTLKPSIRSQCSSSPQPHENCQTWMSYGTRQQLCLNISNLQQYMIYFGQHIYQGQYFILVVGYCIYSEDYLYHIINIHHHISYRP